MHRLERVGSRRNIGAAGKETTKKDSVRCEKIKKNVNHKSFVYSQKDLRIKFEIKQFRKRIFEERSVLQSDPVRIDLNTGKATW